MLWKINFEWWEILTASPRAWIWRAESLLHTSWYLELNQVEKLTLLKNLLYNPSQSPLIPVVSWGPDDSNVARNSSGLKGLKVGADWVKIINKI